SVLRALEATAVREVKPGLLRFPVWPARWAIAIGFAVLACEYSARVWEEWHSTPTAASLIPSMPSELQRMVGQQGVGPQSRIIDTLDRLNENERES
ncbi:MAG: hypothetical protein JJE47_01610, partial [Acidimicrobiia bacterium]|nr:hypothetical protein [Acidimicrobiia bacterium]